MRITLECLPLFNYYITGTYPNMCVTGILPKKVYVTSGNGLIVRFTIETEEAFSFLDHFTIKFNAFYYGKRFLV